jgi:hypothetical protein
MPDDYNPLVDAAPYTSLQGTQQFWDDTLRYAGMPAPGAPNPDENFYGKGFGKTYDTLDYSMVHAPPHGNEESTVATQDTSWQDQAPSLTDISWDHFPKVTSGQSLPVVKSSGLSWDAFPQIGGAGSIPLRRPQQPIPQQPPVLTTSTSDTSAGVTPAQTPAVTTGPSTLTATKPILGTYRAMSFGPGNFPGADKPTSAVMYGALTDARGNPVKMTTSDLAISPNLLKKHGLKLGDYVDVLDDKGNVVYPRQRLADKSYISKGKPTTDTIELWGRPDIGYAQIRPSS